jgi:hypothetical protein
MERETLESMLAEADGVQRSEERYLVGDGFRLSLYVGEPGQAMEVAEVSSLQMRDAYCQISSSETNTVFYLEYSSLHGIAVRAPNSAGGRRAGFL